MSSRALIALRRFLPSLPIIHMDDLSHCLARPDDVPNLTKPFSLDARAEPFVTT